MHWNTWIGGRSIEDGSRLYINEGNKMLLLIEALSDWTKDVALLSYCPADMPQDLLLFMMLAADILFFKATQSICRIPVMETNKCSMSKTLRNFHHRMSRPTRHSKVLDLCNVSVREAHAVNLWPCVHWGQLITTVCTLSLWSCTLLKMFWHGLMILLWLSWAVWTVQTEKMFKKKKNLQGYWRPQRCCQLLAVTLYQCFYP